MKFKLKDNIKFNDLKSYGFRTSDTVAYYPNLKDWAIIDILINEDRIIQTPVFYGVLYKKQDKVNALVTLSKLLNEEIIEVIKE